MQFERAQALERATAKEPGRYAMHGILIERTSATEGKAIATNGRILAIVPITLSDDDVPGLIPSEAWTEARRGSSRFDPRIDANGSVRAHGKRGIVEMERPQGEFPRYETILNACGDGPSVAFNADYLADLQAAFGSECVELTFQPGKTGIDPCAPIHVRANRCGGVMMPITVDGGPPKREEAAKRAAEKAEKSAPDHARALEILAAQEKRIDELSNETLALDSKLGGSEARARALESKLAEAYGTIDALRAMLDRSESQTASRASEPNPARIIPDETPEETAALDAANAPLVREGTTLGYVELVFARKPGRDVRDELKSAGFRWSSAAGLWWGREDKLPARFKGAERALDIAEDTTESAIRVPIRMEAAPGVVVSGVALIDPPPSRKRATRTRPQRSAQRAEAPGRRVSF